MREKKLNLFLMFCMVLILITSTACSSDKGVAEKTDSESSVQSEQVVSSDADEQSTEEQSVNEEPSSSELTDKKPSDDGKITITLITGNGKTDQTMEITSGDMTDVLKLEAPDRAGCEFTGWYLDEYRTQLLTEDTLLEGDCYLYAGYKSNGKTFSSYEADMPVDSKFVLYSTEQITDESLEEYIGFEDVYGGGVKLQLTELDAKRDLNEETLKKLNSEGVEISTVTGEFRYELSASNGFGQGQLYSITALKPDTTVFLSANDISLSGNDAVTLNFKVAEEKLDNRKEKDGIIKLSEGDSKSITSIGSNRFIVEMNPSVKLSAEDVVYIPKNSSDGDSGDYFKVISADENNTYTMEIAGSSDVWDTYELSVDTGDMTNIVFEPYENVESEVAKEIETSIGYAAYVQAVLDGVKASPEVQEQLENVSQEDYDAFMGLTAAQLGFGPEELTAIDCEDNEGKEFGSVKFSTGKTDSGVPFIEIGYDSKEFNFTIGKNQKTGLTGVVTLQFSVSENCSVSLYARTIKQNNTKYASMTDDFTHIGLVPDSTTKVNFSATLKLGKDDDESDTKDKFKTDLGVELGDSDDETELNVSIGEASYDLWKYVESMQSKMQGQDELYDMDLDYVNILNKKLGSFTFTCSGIESIKLTFSFNISVAAQLTISSSLSYEYMEDCYIANGSCKYDNGKLTDIQIYGDNDKLSSYVSGSRVLTSDLNVVVAMQGGLGIRFGLGLELNLGAFQMNDLLSVGVEAEAGPYAELTGYFAYKLNKYYQQDFADMFDHDGPSFTSTTSAFAGGAKASAGIFVTLSAKVTAIKTWEIGLADWKFPLWEQVLGSYNSKASVYANFVDRIEYVDLFAQNSLDLTKMAKSTAVTQKVRSTESTDVKQLEKDIGDDKSSGLLLLKGDTASGTVTTEQLAAGDYEYKIAQITMSNEGKAEVRGYDGRLKNSATSCSKAQDVAAYAWISANGVLKVNDGSPDMTIKVLVKAKGVENVFTADKPSKVFYINYSSASSGQSVASYKINFYDTDGNLLIQDVYQSGTPVVTFPQPGYTSEGNYWNQYYYYSEGNEMFVNKEVARYTGNGDWAKTVGDYWGYPADDWNYDSAYWSDSPMLSGTQGKHITADSLGTLSENIDVYLHMDTKKDLQATWTVNWLDPDTLTVNKTQTVKTASYKYGQEGSLADEAPKVSEFTKSVDGKEKGAFEKVSSWTTLRTSAAAASDTKSFYLITSQMYTEEHSNGTYSDYATMSYKKVSRRALRDTVEYATANAQIDHYIWENVYFSYGGRSVAVKTNIGDVPKVPNDFKDNTEIIGWTDSYYGLQDLNYSNLLRYHFSMQLTALKYKDTPPIYNGITRAGSNIASCYYAAVENPDGSYEILDKLRLSVSNGYYDYSDSNISAGIYDVTYSKLNTIKDKLYNSKDVMLFKNDSTKTASEQSALYSADRILMPSINDFENGIVDSQFASLGRCSEKDGKFYLEDGEMYPIIVVFTTKGSPQIIFDAQNTGTLSAADVWWNGNLGGKITNTVSEDRTKYTITWTKRSDDNISYAVAPIIKSNGTVDDGIMESSNWVWRSTEKVGGKYITVDDGEELTLNTMSIPAGETVRFIPYFNLRKLTINIKGHGTDSVVVYKKANTVFTLEDATKAFIAKTGIVNSSDYKLVSKDLPYTFGSKDTSEYCCISDSITAEVKIKATSMLYMNGGSFHGESTVVIKGFEEDTINLSDYIPDSPRKISANNATIEMIFDGWVKQGTTEKVESIHYGENAGAEWKEGRTWIGITLKSGDGKFAQDKTELSLDFETSLSLGAQTGYQKPTPNDKNCVFDHWVIEGTETEITASADINAIGTSGVTLVAVYNDEYDDVTFSSADGYKLYIDGEQKETKTYVAAKNAAVSSVVTDLPGIYDVANSSEYTGDVMYKVGDKLYTAEEIKNLVVTDNTKIIVLPKSTVMVWFVTPSGYTVVQVGSGSLMYNKDELMYGLEVTIGSTISSGDIPTQLLKDASAANIAVFQIGTTYYSAEQLKKVVITAETEINVFVGDPLVN